MSKSNDQVMISSAQVRAARGLLNWTQSELADKCNLTKATIANIENDKHHLTSKTANKIHQAFRSAKVEFLINDGIRSKFDIVKTLDGREGVIYLLNDIYDSVKDVGGCVKISGIEKKSLIKIIDNEYLEMHENRMEKVNNLSSKILSSDEAEDIEYKSYREYRQIPSEYFFPLPIYIYDRKVAFVMLDPLRVLLIENFHLFLVNSNQFDMIWDNIAKKL
ncbi:helix-turn-helix domain-containing protein [Candidatus Bandiella numerosa]|jgi:transcriptional regulator with XRE-family HTH domain|uniref:helix-turn-helix domain-containing protein n=1 Tax=Candidatus Bandiella numerosa TaxID=2570586 RepID=UPI00249E23A0|nr:helix-turn-helix transcriptional regulator [Candidatus Bandiella numerosa]WHA05469.1 helix-turn-helix domain-containing protein [Candidatus Bandiella numerosa]